VKAQRLPAELVRLLHRLQQRAGEALELAADDLAAWPAGLADALLAQGAMERAAPADSVICPGCEEACAMRVHVRPRPEGAPSAFVVCDKRDDMGRVPVTLGMLERRHVTPRTLANALSRALGQPGPTPLAEGLRLGWVEGGAGRAAVHLVVDGRALALIVAGYRLEAAAVLTWDGVRLGLDLAALRRHADAVVGTGAGESPEDRQRRLLALVAAERKRNPGKFLKAAADKEGITVYALKQVIYRKPKAPPADAMAGMARTLGSPVSKKAPRKR
jgi:hypothetical protein